MTAYLSPEEAERLLGGHAAGILTDEERSALFKAALEHQAVFDALMDEEALRELLADHAARTRLLAVLSETPAAKPRSFWRGHPALLGLAASLLLALTASLVYLRNPEIRPKALPQLQAPEAQPKATSPPAPAPKADAAPKPVVTPPVGPRLRSGVPEAPSPAAAAPAAPAPPPAAVVERSAPAAMMEQAKEAPREERKAEIKDQASDMKGGAGGSITANSAPAQIAKAAKKKVAQPIWRLEGRSLTVEHPEGQWVGLLRRGSGAPLLLSGQLLAPGLTRIDLGAEAGPWDLYVLPSPPEAPLRLPAEGPVVGYRVRIPDPGR